MKTNIEMKNLESQVIECYSYFMNNYQNTNFDALESMVLQLQKSMNLLTIFPSIILVTFANIKTPCIC